MSSPAALVDVLRQALDAARIASTSGSLGTSGAHTDAARQLLREVEALLPPHNASAQDPQAPSVMRLGPELLGVVFSYVKSPEDLARLNCVCRQFHTQPTRPRPPSVVERALRARMAREGLAIPADLAPGAPETTQTLLLWECQRRGVGQRAMAAGAMHSVFISADGQLLTCGGGEVEEDGKAAASPPGAGVPAVAEGADLSPASRLAVLGRGGAAISDPLVPRAVAGMAKTSLRSVSSSRYHVLTVTDDGRVFSFGDGENGVLGHGDESHQLVPRLVDALSTVCVASASAGDNHSLFVSAEGSMYSCGYGARGRLGHGDENSVYAPQRIEALRDVRIASASAGSFHSLAVSSDGRVFSFGRRNHGVLGLGDRSQDLCHPVVISALKDVRAVRALAGLSHSLVVNDEGNVYSFGSGKSGQLGHGDRADQALPKLVDKLTDIRVLSASAGHDYSILVCAEGIVYTCGAGSTGVLGHGDRQDQLLPRRVEALNNVRVVSASAGLCHALFAAADGAVLGTGDGNGGSRGMKVANSTVPETMPDLRVRVMPGP